jgi:type VI secretion system secreted protein Hcp
MAAVDYFLKLDGIEGESADHKHKSEIELQSWSFGATQGGIGSTSGGLGAGKVSVSDFNFVMHANKASPKLFLACCTGEHIKKAQLTCRKAGKEQQEFLKWEFTEVMVSSYQTGGSHENPTESISLHFNKVKISYAPQKADGTLDAYTDKTYIINEQKAE